MEVHVPLMKMRCAQNSSDFGGVGKGDCRSEKAT